MYMEISYLENGLGKLLKFTLKQYHTDTDYWFITIAMHFHNSSVNTYAIQTLTAI